MLPYHSFQLVSALTALTLASVASAWGAPITRTYSQVQEQLRQTVQENPQNAQLFMLGQSDSGLPIEGLKIGNGSVKNLLVATHHGNEYGSTEVALAFMKDLAKSPIRNQTVYVIPVLNISGYNSRSRYETQGGKRWDPNRNYPGPCGTEGPFTLKSTTALAQFVDREGIIASATLHTFYPAVVYPWGISSHDLSTGHDELFRELAQAATIESKYRVGNSTEVIYAADGTYEDYAYWAHGVWSLLFELGFSHSPSEADVQRMIAVNLPGIRRMMETAPTSRAEKHDFTGRCDRLLRQQDRHDE